MWAPNIYRVMHRSQVRGLQRWPAPLGMIPSGMGLGLPRAFLEIEPGVEGKRVFSLVRAGGTAVA